MTITTQTPKLSTPSSSLPSTFDMSAKAHVVRPWSGQVVVVRDGK